jgi:mRNA-degrading endonuclease RelE of RelBE toxin-antitoxin system
VHYRLSYTEEARRAIPDLPGNYRQRIRREIAALADNPRPAHAERLRETPGLSNLPDRYKIALDRWRLIYRVIEDEQMVRIIRIRFKHGPETYEGLED